jgi:hypothetical protein
MATKTPVQPRPTNAQLAELMSLLRGSDSVELKLTVPPAVRDPRREPCAAPLTADVGHVTALARLNGRTRPDRPVALRPLDGDGDRYAAAGSTSRPTSRMTSTSDTY